MMGNYAKTICKINDALMDNTWKVMSVAVYQPIDKAVAGAVEQGVVNGRTSSSWNSDRRRIGKHAAAERQKI